MQETEPRLKVHFETWGCTTNLGDTRTMEGILHAAGHRLVDDAEAADVVVLNTCTVVETTDAKIGHRLRTLRAAGKRVVATGCMAGARPEALQQASPGMALLPPRHLHHIDDAVAGRPFVPTERAKSGLPRTLGATDAVIQLGEGCLFSCSYCLTKHARGDQSSFPIEDLVADVREAVARGAIDIKLTSQDTSGYGFDGGDRLPELLRRLTDIGGDFRVRVGMMHPRTAHRILPGLLDAMVSPKVYRFLHLPIQTGSARILDAMARGNTLDEFWAVVSAFRRRFPDGIVSTDLIVGFPKETEEDHRATIGLVRRLQAEHVNVTRFSPRPGTPAKAMPGRVDTQTAKRRSSELVDVALHVQGAAYRRFVGETLSVFVLEGGKKPGSVLCRGPAYQPVVVRRPVTALPLGSRVDVRVTTATQTYLVAEPIGEPVRVAKGSARRLPDGPSLPVLPVVSG